MIKKIRSISKTIDMAIMLTVFGNNTAAIAEYIGNFIERTSELLQELTLAIQQNNADLAMDCLHKLKGPAGSSGFRKIYKLCEKVEEKVLQSDWAAANNLCYDIEKALKKIQWDLENNFLKK